MANVITVTALNQYVKALLEQDVVLTDIAIRGEISNFTNHFKTGHCYFSLKDEGCNVKAVMFRTYAQQLAFVPQNGMHVIVRCRVSLYERDGAFQLYVEDMFPDGIGAMQLAYEQTKAKLEAEGLFEPERKKPLPLSPKCIGLVTSKTGAAVQDILQVAKRRNPGVHFLLAGVNVQGEDAAAGIVAAIQMLDQSGLVDVIIVARGGGSREDLWVFNHETIARAAYACTTPLVSAIGHEIDFCILDFVADLRAPTPSAAAELVVPDVQAQFAMCMQKYTNIHKLIQNKIKLWYNTIERYAKAPVLLRMQNLPNSGFTMLEKKRAFLTDAMQNKLLAAHSNLAKNAQLSTSLNPHAVLARGYSIATLRDKPLKNAQHAARGDMLQITLSQGSLLCEVTEILTKGSEPHGTGNYI